MKKTRLKVVASVALALVMCMGLTVPAFAAQTGGVTGESGLLDLVFEVQVPTKLAFSVDPFMKDTSLPGQQISTPKDFAVVNMTDAAVKVSFDLTVGDVAGVKLVSSDTDLNLDEDHTGDRHAYFGAISSLAAGVTHTAGTPVTWTLDKDNADDFAFTPGKPDAIAGAYDATKAGTVIPFDATDKKATFAFSLAAADMPNGSNSAKEVLVPYLNASDEADGLVNDEANPTYRMPQSLVPMFLQGAPTVVADAAGTNPDFVNALFTEVEHADWAAAGYPLKDFALPTADDGGDVTVKVPDTDIDFVNPAWVAAAILETAGSAIGWDGDYTGTAVECTQYDDKAVAASDKGVAAFKFYGLVDTYAEWKAGDLDLTGTYKLTGITADDYAAFEAVDGSLNLVPVGGNAAADPGFTPASINASKAAVAPVSSVLTVGTETIKPGGVEWEYASGNKEVMTATTDYTFNAADGTFTLVRSGKLSLSATNKTHKAHVTLTNDVTYTLEVVWAD